ncbi:MAG: hypothetical protein LM580_11445 [Thermofilum sp.]|nr:hypothetical protein [Thermofilum sp.]
MVALRRARRGQLALIGVIVLASTLIALLSAYSLQPKIAYERGHLQAAQLVHLARACMAAGSCTRDRLANYTRTYLYPPNNGTYPLRTFVTYVARGPDPGPIQGDNPITVTNETVFEIETLRTLFTGSTERVSITVQTVSEPTGRRYSKQLGDRVYTMVEVRVTYTHSYSSPFFNVTLCPSLRTTDGVADLKRLGKCDWLVGAPLELSKPVGANRYRYDVRDEFGIPVPVLFTVPPKG